MRDGEAPMRLLTDYLTVLGWAVVGAIAMAIALALLLRGFAWLAPVEEWADAPHGGGRGGRRLRPRDRGGDSLALAPALGGHHDPAHPRAHRGRRARDDRPRHAA